MSRVRAIPAVALLVLASCVTGLTAQVSGRVVDSDNRPVQGALISLGAYPAKPEEPALESPPLHSDANGEFRGAIKFRHYGGQTVRALDPDLGRGGVAHVNRQREPVTIVVNPLTRVKGRVNYDKIPRIVREHRNTQGFRYRSLFVTKRGESGTARQEYAASVRLEEGDFEFLLPAGTYNAVVQGVHQPLNREFTVSSGEKELDLGVLEALPTPGDEIYGGIAPEIRFADARGLHPDFRMSWLRGKWVLLYLWDYRNKANNWLDELIGIHNAFPDKRDRFEIIAVHNCDDVLTVNEFERARQMHEGRNQSIIPFPLVVDDEHRTFNAYGVVQGVRRHAGWLFLVNPEGVVEYCPGAPGPMGILRAKLTAK